MILSEPSIIFIWTYQGMMKWMNRILVGEMPCVGDYFIHCSRISNQVMVRHCFDLQMGYSSFISQFSVFFILS
jgi:hypothetical protein